MLLGAQVLFLAASAQLCRLLNALALAATSADHDGNDGRGHDNDDDDDPDPGIHFLGSLPVCPRLGVMSQYPLLDRTLKGAPVLPQTRIRISPCRTLIQPSGWAAHSRQA